MPFGVVKGESVTTIVPRERRIDAIGFYEVLDQVLDLLQRRSQITCHALKRGV